MTRRVVLVGDADAELRALASLVQANAGAETMAFTSAALALSATPALRPELVVVDAGAPRADAMQVLDAVRADPRLRDIPVVVIAPEDDRDVRYDALERGANDVLGRPLDVGELARRLENLLTLGASRNELTASLADEARRGREHAARLEALWRLGATPLDGDAFLRAMLAEASGVLRADARFSGFVAHLDGPDVVVDVSLRVPATLLPPEGGRYPVARSLAGEILREGRTMASDDATADPRFAAKLRAPIRALLGTPFHVGETRYFIVFCSLDSLERPFDADDRAYIETLASFSAARLHQRAQADRLRYHLDHDALTGTLNRTAFRTRGFEALQTSDRIGLVVVDVDRFREVNDLYGDRFGDAVLVEIGAALQSRSEGDVVARLGGDRFGILLHRVGDRADVERRLQPYVDTFAMPFGSSAAQHATPIGLTASFGIAIAPDDGDAFEQLIARADGAVEAAKSAGRARWAFFDRRVEEGFAAARRMQNELAEALVREEFVIHMQPHVDFATRSLVGAEALIRWQHPERGLLAPAEFLPFAETHGMLGAIGDWVMRETARISRPWRRADPSLRIWFNVSAVELADPALVHRLRELDEDLAGLGVELTEAVAMRDLALTQRSVDALHEVGVRVALDDFGTGYSSLARLKRLPIDVVKIDRVFVAGLPGDAQDAAIVDAIVGIAQSFEFELLAEGVETEEQARWLAGAGCAYGQGFVFAPPMTPSAFEAWRSAHETSRHHGRT